MLAEPTIEDALKLLQHLTPAELQYIDASSTWAPLPGPQLQAWRSEADELFYGGQAGGGKTDFVCGLSLEEHQVSIIYRRESPQLAGITDRFVELLGGKDQFHGGDRVWRPGGGRQVEYGSMPNLGDEQRYQGRPHDLLVFDEVTQFLELQYRYLQTWNRSVDPEQRCRSVATGNPPTTPEGLWVTDYWGPWLREDHRLFGRVKPGELLYFVTIKGEDVIVEDGGPFKHPETGRWIMPRSRTFIPASIEENPFLLRTGYADALESLPEPLRSQMRDGSFTAGQHDHEWQVIPSAWVDAAQTRWRMRQNDPRGPMSALGVDPSRGGQDKFLITPRYGSFFGEQVTYPGSAAPNGAAGAALVIQHMRNGCPVNVDVIGIGSAVVDFLEGTGGFEVNAIYGSAAAPGMDKTGKLRFVNLRAKQHWHMRELLDPANPDPIALPPTPSLKADLCAPRYRVGPQGILVESKDDIKKRLGHSPDEGDSCIYAAHDYDSAGGLSAAMLHEQKDSHFDGPYKRDPNVINTPGQQAAHQTGWTGFGGKIVYPDE